MLNRTIIFAHFDKHNLIDNYVLHYLKELKKISNQIIFVSDCNLPEKELLKLNGITSYNIAKRHNEYDWGSYKYGYLYLQENDLLKNIDELVLCNDSVYGPFLSLEKFLNSMSNSNFDFNGFYKNVFNQNNETIPHLQSWFLFLKKQVFNSNEFKNFILDIKHLDKKEDIISKYEIDFTVEMSKKFSWGYLYTSKGIDVVYRSPYKLIELGFPFCKTNVVAKYNMLIYIWIKNKMFYNLISQHQARCYKRNVFTNNLRFLKNLKYIFCSDIEINLEN